MSEVQRLPSTLFFSHALGRKEVKEKGDGVGKEGCDWTHNRIDKVETSVWNCSRKAKQGEIKFVVAASPGPIHIGAGQGRCGIHETENKFIFFY